MTLPGLRASYSASTPLRLEVTGMPWGEPGRIRLGCALTVPGQIPTVKRKLSLSLENQGSPLA